MLGVIRNLFSELNSKNIRYVHWKSNEHLNESLLGETDFDILVAKEELVRFVHTIENYGFRLFESVGKQSYITIFDYILLDSESYNVVHIHLHTAFVTGTKFLKEYAIPLEEEMLDGWQYDETGMVKMINSSKEIVILWLRYFLKTSTIKYILKRGKIGEGFWTESEWLAHRKNDNEVSQFLGFIFDESEVDVQKEFLEFINGNKSITQCFQVLKHVRKSLKRYKTQNMIMLRYSMRRICMVSRYIFQKYCRMVIPYRRVSLSGGVIIAVMGCDGAGKSTVTKKILNSLRRKVDVYFEYFGSGDGYSSWYRYPFLVVHRIINKLHKNDGYNIKESIREVSKSKKISLLKAVWAILLACEKRSKLKKVNTAKAKGFIVLCDRYPQTQFMGINDGPLLFAWMNEQNQIKKKIAKWEYNIYKHAEKIKPDILVKLMITEDISRERKPEEKLDRIKRKIELMDNLSIPARQSIRIDATEKLEKVLKNVYSVISECISKK